jgi:hypothetical protein
MSEPITITADFTGRVPRREPVGKCAHSLDKAVNDRRRFLQFFHT